MSLSNEDHGRYKSFTRRAALLAGGKTLLFAALGGRLYYLQMVESERFMTLAEDNRINLRLLAPPRGRILDRFGVPLAVNQQNYRVVMIPEQSPDPKIALDLLGKVISLDEDERNRILRDIARKRGFVPVTVQENLTWQQVSRIEVNAPDLPGINIEVGQTRRYPHGANLVHILGYVAAVSEGEQTGDPLLELPGFRIGKSGIEKQYDGDLRGAAGNSQVEVNAVGRVIRELTREEGQPGQDLVLTIDAKLQNYAQQRLLGHRSAAAVVLDATNGDVLALSSVPGYDPSAFNIGLSQSQWRKLAQDPLAPLTNKAIGGLYAPGSTFKVIVALAAMKAGISTGHKAFCPGFVKLGNARFHCWRKWGHGWVDMIDGIKHSCDVYFYDLAKRVGIDAISDMAHKFGLGAPVDLDLPGERGGVVPTREWKLATIGEPWQKGETLITAIGQGFVLATPLQLAVMTARIANGGQAVKPRLVRRRDQAEPLLPKLDVSESHLKMVRKAMDAVTNEKRGTAFRARIEQEGWEMAGKTGTSQVRRISLREREQGVKKNEELPWRYRDHALFIGFAPVHNPRYCCAVVVEHGGGGSKAAAPIARDLLIETQRLDPAGRPDEEVVAAKTGPEA